MRKQQIQIPFDKGRSMLGVVDETGQLQYGQVFVQYTENIALKTPPPNASRKVLTGKVLITKNPCIVAGDVRVFTAVDVPELHHMCDVVVFPMHGPRPHPDEMAGSDLDGDEYSVIWDNDLLLDRNEEPFDYTADKPETKPISKETLNEDMVDFYISYITQDSVGTISNSFLFQADLYGLKSEVTLISLISKRLIQLVILN
ncbi:RNA dependent RNA polymerase [Necator americanus]|uniref:RNA-dependent RNA polymerase n=1 Tax=Necator americanus TaxID=51031 RepID=W2T415_NECAM|nr:RNA dependent RNA polymerase [Necator americanus]ETN76653.1 RNA dependent RNA polymerase [Necator americanus]